MSSLKIKTLKICCIVKLLGVKNLGLRLIVNKLNILKMNFKISKLLNNNKNNKYNKQLIFII